jgi:hypothetical protein
MTLAISFIIFILTSKTIWTDHEDSWETSVRGGEKTGEAAPPASPSEPLLLLQIPGKTEIYFSRNMCLQVYSSCGILRT